MRKICLSLGSNMGDKMAYLNSAIEKIRQIEGVQIDKISSIYETEPVGHVEQDVFLNFVMTIYSDVDPHTLLFEFQKIEKDLKRERIIRWGPRTIDIDILYADDYECDDDVLTMPHPRMLERAFVLIPIYEIEPDLVVNERSIHYWVSRFSSEGVEIYKSVK